MVVEVTQVYIFCVIYAIPGINLLQRIPSLAPFACSFSSCHMIRMNAWSPVICLSSVMSSLPSCLQIVLQGCWLLPRVHWTQLSHIYSSQTASFIFFLSELLDYLAPQWKLMISLSLFPHPYNQSPDNASMSFLFLHLLILFFCHCLILSLLAYLIIHYLPHRLFFLSKISICL